MLDRTLREQMLQQQSGAPIQGAARPPPAPVVEYLEDSKVSVEYFRMKGSVFFSAIDKDDSDQLKKETKLPKKTGEENVKFFNISAANQDEFILSSIMVPFLNFRWTTRNQNKETLL